ncbi:MAG: peptide deformylase [Azospirillum sp.]|nr:peptide deformylase [Azospirillum sp.]
MTILPILIAPDPRLKLKAKPVVEVDRRIVRLMDDMLETMYANKGIGLAAPQVDVRERVIVADVAEKGEPRQPIWLANPEVVEASPDLVPGSEGCLSLPDHYADVIRPSWVRIRYLDRDGVCREMAADGLLSICLQHEIDHLDGILFVDHVSLLKRNMILRKLQKAKRQGVYA